ncbi:MAG: transcriptional regulator TrmB [Candidatus Taylorbacteria bacterium]|nr:transcriptional regulator TrmB [Candidatus Taylorbacteria bacterium]
MEFDKQLQLLGLPEKEARVYIHALSLASFNVSQISERSSLKRPTCYLILEELAKKGYVSRIPNMKKVHYRAEPPEVVVRQAENNVNFAHKLLPKLNEIYRRDRKMPVVRYYSGQQGFRNIFEDTLKSKAKNFYNISGSVDVLKIAGIEFAKNYVSRRVQKKISIQNVRPKSYDYLHEELHEQSSSYLREVRFTPPDIDFLDTIFVYGNKVAILSAKKDNFAVLIESQEVADTHLALFKALWRVSTPGI